MQLLTPTQKLGFVAVTTDFWYPGVMFDGGIGLLCRATPKSLPD